MTLIITAHQLFKQHYPRTIRLALAMAILMHLCIFAFGPPMDFKPYRTPDPIQPPTVVDIKEVSNVVMDKPLPEIDDPVDPQPADDSQPPQDDPPPFVEPPAGGDPGPGSTPVPPSTPYVAFDKPPVPIRLERPRYPILAREAGIEGMVRVLVLIDERGRVRRASVHSSDATPAMEQEALRAARRSVFEPALQGTTPVRSKVVIPFQFRLQ